MTAHAAPGPALPAPREPGRYRVGMVCLGNICRSPVADTVLRAKVAEAGLDDRVEVDSCGTGGWHVGDPMDERAAASLAAAGYDGSRHRAQQWAERWLDDHDLLLAMDAANLRDVGGRTDRVWLLRDLDPAGPGDVPDPYYGGDDGFREVLAMVERCCDVLVAGLDELLA
ncbi:low molecular weight protein-tyrosine-phosphatase [Nocardioides litoris]|uniref:low molecular weight protein-tyrosine-phosphatase n=1 Tax=Nocardioides litoris TaxID=1926648 RepID=UPI0011203998|nr:low molecular weight protein-tyrosine-phosphatase [Nocardioides litoris]